MRISPVILAIICFFLTNVKASDEGNISSELLNRYRADIDKNTSLQAMINAVAANRVSDLALNREKLLQNDPYFNHKITTTDITDQKSSGRCWMFAGANILSPIIKKKLDIKDFEISHAYLAFWDRLEKANLFLEQVIAFRDLPLDDRKMDIILSEPYGDGGWWHYFVSLVDKYGLVPASVMPETYQSSSTGLINSLTNTKLRTFTIELRRMHHEGKKLKQLRQRKEEMIGELYKFLVLNYGQPPDEFVFRYETKDTVNIDSGDSTTVQDKGRKIIISRNFTPLSFYKEFIGDQLPEFVALTDNPSKSYRRLYQGEWSRNIYENSDFTMLNLPVQKLKDYCRASLLDSQAVWFACDVGKDHYGDSGLFVPGIYAYDKLYGMDFKMTKAERLEYLDSWASHAMTLVGVDTNTAGQPLKWLVKNSWGTKRGDDGYWTMYDDWFDEFVYVIIINKKYLTAEDRDIFKKKPVILPLWDVFSRSLKKLN